jgi:hypothetical protein
MSVESMNENRIELFIYVLVDPRNGYEFYVGITSDPRRRLSAHITLSKNLKCRQYARSVYIREMMATGYKPEIKVIDSIVCSNLLLNWLDAPKLEKYWIKEYKSQGKAWCNDQIGIMNVS